MNVIQMLNRNRILRVTVAGALALIGYQLAGASILWRQISHTNPAILGRYTPRFFLFMLVYHTGMIVWLVSIVGVFGAVQRGRQERLLALANQLAGHWIKALGLVLLTAAFTASYSLAIIRTDWATIGAEVILAPISTIVYTVLLAILAAHHEAVSRAFGGFIRFENKHLRIIITSLAVILVILLIFDITTNRAGGIFVLGVYACVFLFVILLVTHEAEYPHWIADREALLGIAALLLLFNLWKRFLPFSFQSHTAALIAGFVGGYYLLLTVMQSPHRSAVWLFAMVFLVNTGCTIVTNLWQGIPSLASQRRPTVELIDLRTDKNDNLEFYLYLFEHYRGSTLAIPVEQEMVFDRRHIKYWGGVEVEEAVYSYDMPEWLASQLEDAEQTSQHLDGEDYVFVAGADMPDKLWLFLHDGVYYVVPEAFLFEPGQ